LNEQGERILFEMKNRPVLEKLYFALWWLNLIPKSRQHGVSTFIAIFMLDACLFNSNIRAGIVAHKLRDAIKIFRDKIKYAYDNLPTDLKAERVLVKDDSQELVFSNNSGIYVGTSMRSGTLQYLHISEYGWLCTHKPIQAAEIKAGTMETVHEDGLIFIESTVEGPTGDFPDMCKEAEAKRQEGKELGPLDYKIHFFPWHEKPSNVTDPKYIKITKKDNAYFDRLEKLFNKKITKPQRAYYVGKKATLGRLIYKEHPSTLDEAFMASVIGSYHGEVIDWLYENGRIGDLPFNPNYLVYTMTDPGYTSAWWFFQVLPTGFVHFIRYHEDTGRDMAYYADMLAKLKDEEGYRYGKHFAPIDVDNNQYKIVDGDGLKEVARRAGINFDEIPFERSTELGRQRTNIFLKTCRFDKANCHIGINKLKAFHEELNHQMSTDETPVFTGVPCKDGNDHAADCMRGVSMIIGQIDSVNPAATKQSWQELKERMAC
jgi:hypothetical protein